MAPRTDKTIRIARFFSFPKVLVYVLVALLLAVALVHWARLGYRLVAARRGASTSTSTNSTSNSTSTTGNTTTSTSNNAHDLNGNIQRTHPTRTRKPLLRRLPLALFDWLRATSMRRTVRLLWGAQLNWLEVAVTVGYMALLLGFVFAGTTTLEGQRVEPHYYANRAGTIAASQFPIMTALGMRNNPFSWLTGISFDKLNYLHRAAARALVIIVWIHAGGRLTVGLLDDETPTHPWVRSGFAAAATLTLLCLVTFRPVRKRMYEVFVGVHFVLAGVTLLTLLKHLSGRSLTAYGAWPSLLLWGVDRSLRGVQYLVHNYPYLVPSFLLSGDRRRCDAQIEVLRVRRRPVVGGKGEDDEQEDEPRFLRITLRRPNFRWRAGQSAFIAFPTVGLTTAAPNYSSGSGVEGGEPKRGAVTNSGYTPSATPLRAHPFQSHPFTIMAYDYAGSGSGLWSFFGLFSRKKTTMNTGAQQRQPMDARSGGRSSDDPDREKDMDVEKGSPSPSPSSPASPSKSSSFAAGQQVAANDGPAAANNDTNELVFVVRVRKGMTRALWDLAASSAPAARGANDDMKENGSGEEGGDRGDYGGTGLKCTVPAFISGPYSNPPVLVGYRTVLLIAGGTGVAFTLPLFLDVVERAKRGERSCENLVFVWAVRDIDHLKWIERAVLDALSMLPTDAALNIRYLFCITGRDEDVAGASTPRIAGDATPDPEGDIEAAKLPSSQGHAGVRGDVVNEGDDLWSGSAFTPSAKQLAQFARLGSQKDSTSILHLPGVRVINSKPPIERLVRYKLGQCQGRMSVNVCGTPSLSNSVRKVLAQERVRDVMSLGPAVTLHVEAFGG